MIKKKSSLAMSFYVRQSLCETVVSATKRWNIRAVFFPRPKATGNVGYVSSMYSTPETVDSLKGKLNLRDIVRGKKRLLQWKGRGVTWEKYLITSRLRASRWHGIRYPILITQRGSRRVSLYKKTLHTELSIYRCS